MLIGTCIADRMARYHQSTSLRLGSLTCRISQSLVCQFLQAGIQESMPPGNTSPASKNSRISRRTKDSAQRLKSLTIDDVFTLPLHVISATESPWSQWRPDVHQMTHRYFGSSDCFSVGLRIFNKLPYFYAMIKYHD